MTDEANFPIVGIGASAGGIEALEGFFSGVPEHPGMSFVVVTHLSPTRESLLHEILQRYTVLPVKVAANGMQVEYESVYVMPGNAVLSIADGVLKLQPQKSDQPERKPVDVFFSALSADRSEFCAGVVLSGGDTDGTLGIKAIKLSGGLTLAQVTDGSGPGHPSMPDSAISSGLVDFALPTHEMGGKLVEYANSLATAAGLAKAANHSDQPADLEASREAIYAILRSKIGHDFSGYKSKTFMRRVQRRMLVNQTESAQAYVALLQQNAAEIELLFKDLLINVTQFFRDPEAFRKLSETVIPELFAGRSAEDTIRVWVPGCATGEEVYSLGILLREQMDRAAAVPRVQLFATDIDEHALSVARAGRYPEELLQDVSPERRRRFFIPDGGSFVLGKEIRDLCIFSPHSVIRDPPFSRMDLVSCRNLLIYFGTDVQNQVIPTFHYALRTDGILFLGSSENVSQFDDLFSPLDKKFRIFRRRSDVAPQVRLPLMLSALRPGQAYEMKSPRPQLNSQGLRQSVDAHVLERFSPPHVLANREGDVVYYSSRTGKYLEAPPGVPSRQILTMARKGLRVDLRTVFREAVETGHTASRDGVAVEEQDGRVQMINLTVEPLNSSGPAEPLFLVLFTDQGPLLTREEAMSRAGKVYDGSAFQIELELRETRERLQAMIEEYETALEELKSSNEELVSVNEELQSTNEELEASKEELVSLNEELHTVNGELNGKLDSLDRANSDLQNLFDSTAMATVFLDSKLVIRSFTPAMSDVFNILPTDRGRPITDLSSRLMLSGLANDIANAFNNDTVFERRVSRDDNQEHYLVRFAPYRIGQNRTDGVVITFVNITGVTRAEKHQQILIAELQHRTGNLLSVVQSIAQQTLGKHAAVAAFNTRLAALGRLQALLGQASSDRIDLADIVQLELDTLGRKNDSAKVALSGPRVPLNLEYVQAIALAIHELATNAVKYGALRNDVGHLNVAWQVERRQGEMILILDWRESGLPSPPDSSHRGYGRQLIEQALGFSLRAKTDLVFGNDGVTCRIELPLQMPDSTASDPMAN